MFTLVPRTLTARSVSASALWVLIAFIAFAAPSPQPPAPSPQPPIFHTEANYVRVDVYPTKDGAPIADLTRADFEVFDNGVPQTIDAFQHIVVQAAGPQQTRREPNTVAESRELLNDPAARAFVVFLDTYHVTVGGSHAIRRPLINALNQTIGENDLVAVMTPEMSAGDLTFARRTTTIEGMLTRYWPWGERDQINSKDPEEDEYWACYPGNTPVPSGCGNPEGDAGIAAEMIDRRRERRTMDAVNDLVRFLRGVREERTAVIVVSSGWLLYRPDPHLAHPIGCPNQSGPDIHVDPATGKLTSKNTSGGIPATMDACERDRMVLANIDDADEFRRTLEEANRANVSFYTIDPRGLAVFDQPIVPVRGPTLTTPAPMVPPSVDNRMLAARIDNLRTMAGDTDGLAVVNNNDLDAGLKRIVSDLTSYYLLGYYATGKLDGKFHTITVRVKRPGVRVRARRGYLAATEEEVAAAAARSRATGTGSATGTAEGEHVGAAAALAASAAAAIAKLAGAGRSEPLRIQATAGWKPGTNGSPVPVFWLVGEVMDRIPGADLDALIVGPSGQTVASARGRVAPGTTGALLSIAPTSSATPGDYTITVRGQLPSGGTMTSVKVQLPAAPRASGAVLIRHGPLTGNRDVPTADSRFRRSEQLTVEVPSPQAVAVSARLLDRNGAEVPVPVAASLRTDADGTRWATAHLALVPLAPGDYVIEVDAGAEGAGGGGTRTLVAFRMVP